MVHSFPRSDAIAPIVAGPVADRVTSDLDWSPEDTESSARLVVIASGVAAY
jgi:hypothetical protein